MKYDEKDVPLFKKVICQHCHCYDTFCQNKNNHWFLMCPKFFNWVIGIEFDGMGYNKKVKPKRDKYKENEITR